MCIQALLTKRICSVFITLFFVVTAQAAWPDKPIRLIVPTGPGGGADTAARFLALKLSEGLGQPIFIENVGGAGGILGADKLAKATPDGYTILFGFNALVTMIPALQAKMPYANSDLEPVGISYRGGYILIANNSVAAKNVSELVALAKNQPGRIAYASTGTGSAAHLGAELFQQESGTQLLHVPFKGPGLLELMGGQVQIKFEPMASGVPLVKSGKVKALAVTGLERAVALPDVQTVSESLPGFELVGWQGLWVPKGTPVEIIKRINSELVKALRLPDMEQRLREAAALPNNPSPESMRTAITSELSQWTRVIRERNIKPE
jgi:tripartite-type tricarboxylate transporter receptor subunit TctC